MNVVGIIAEYNPFHNGHKYHIEKAKKAAGADYVIVVMSGDFTQRGTPALMDKHLRAKMALENGADLVIELPVRYSTGSAEFFAHGAVSILHSLGVVTHICFGSECGSLEKLQAIADVLTNEPPAYKEHLKTLLKEGNSYPQARNTALSYLDCWDFDTYHMLAMPNNILGIEYLKALNDFKSPIIPLTIRRLGSNYNDPNPSGTCSSALAIRSSIYQTGKLKHVKDQIPENVYEILEREYKKSFPIHGLDLSVLVHYKLMQEAENGFSQYVDVSNDLSDKIVKNLNSDQNFNDFCDLLKSKDMTYARISRSLVHILLNLKDREISYPVPYGRILALNTSSEIMGEIKKHSLIPLISKLADAEKYLDDNAMLLLKEDLNASHIYQIIVGEKYGKPFQNEMTREIILK